MFAKKKASKPSGFGKIQKEIERGNNVPKEIDRADPARHPYEKPHIHLKNGTARNYDGTIKHGTSKLPKAVKEWLNKFGCGNRCTMEIYGCRENGRKAFKLSEVSFCVNPEEYEKIFSFFKLVQQKYWKLESLADHVHFRDRNKDWQKGDPDIIVTLGELESY